MTWRSPLFSILISAVTITAVILIVGRLPIDADVKVSLATVLAGVAGVGSGLAGLLLDYRLTDRQDRRRNAGR